MSFKREGNDASLLGTLQRRRIKELLAEDIPEDEAKLLCNGRFACTVCPSNPIFDTVNVLSVHRQGKKHLSNLEVHIAKKQELKQLIASRRHQQYLRDGTTSIQMAVSNDRSLLISSPYDPRVKKTTTQKGGRRLKLEIDDKSGASVKITKSDQSVMTSSAAGSNNKTHNSPTSRVTYDQNFSEPLTHCHQLKNIFKPKIDEPVRITPYQSKYKRNKKSDLQNRDRTLPTKKLHVPTASQDVSLNHKLHTSTLSSPGRRAVTSPKVAAPSQNTSHTDTVTQTVAVVNMSLPLEYVSSSANPLHQSGIQSHHLVPTATVLLPPPPPPPPLSFAGTDNCSSATFVSSTPIPSESSLGCNRLQEPRRMSEKLWQLQGSGWKRDWDGKWIRDEQAEFDSDEEAPDIS